MCIRDRPLAAHAALRQGITRIVNAARLRIKESDRLTAVTQVLTALGADVVEGADRLTITGQPEGLAGGVTVDSHNDHRIAMMAAIAVSYTHLDVYKRQPAHHTHKRRPFGRLF